MYHSLIIGTRHLGRDHTALDHLRQEIAFFETRLSELSELNESTGEPTLLRAYQTLLQERRQQLARYF